MRGGADTDDLLDIITDELMKRTNPAALIAYLADHRTHKAIDVIHQRGTLAMRAALEDSIAAAKARVRQETSPCPI